MVRHAHQTPHHRSQRQPADALYRPIGADLAAGNAPYLFGIGLEKSLVEARSERAFHPVLKAADVNRRAALCEQIADQTAQRLERTEVPQRIKRFERIFEESTA